MKRIWGVIAGLVAAAILAVPLVLAQTGTAVNAIPGSVWTYLGPTFGASWVLPVTSQQGWVPNNAALSALTSAIPQVYRAGFYAPGDGGGMLYTHSATACSLNGGVGDGGSQVKAISGGCWLADFSGTQPTPLVWGAKGDGTTDDRVQVQAAIDALAGKTMYIGAKKYCIGAPGLVANKTIAIEGDATGYPWNNNHPNWGFVACANNLYMLTIGNTGTDQAAAGSRVSGVYFDASNFAGTVTDGAAITVIKSDFVAIDHVATYQTCIGINLFSGSQNLVDYAILGAGGAGHGCGGIRVGGGSTFSSITDDRISNVTSYGAADYGILVLDAGGLMITNTDLLFSTRGLAIQPGVNQSVLFLFANNSSLGDTTCQEGIFIDTTAASGTVGGLMFNGSWSSSAGAKAAGCAGMGVHIQNTGGGVVKNISFLGHRAFANTMQGFLIQENVFDISINSSIICNNSKRTEAFPAEHYAGIAVSLNAGSIAIRDNRISPDCQTFSGVTNNQLVAIALNGNNSGIMVTGNDLHGSDQPLTNIGPAIGADAIIKDNFGVDDHVVDVAANSPLLLGLNPVIAMTGPTGSINQVGQVWNNREVTLMARDATYNFVTGGPAASGATVPICNTRTLTAGQIAKGVNIAGHNCFYVYPP